MTINVALEPTTGVDIFIRDDFLFVLLYIKILNWTRMAQCEG